MTDPFATFYNWSFVFKQISNNKTNSIKYARATEIFKKKRRRRRRRRNRFSVLLNIFTRFFSYATSNFLNLRRLFSLFSFHLIFFFFVFLSCRYSCLSAISRKMSMCVYVEEKEVRIEWTFPSYPIVALGETARVNERAHNSKKEVEARERKREKGRHPEESISIWRRCEKKETDFFLHLSLSLFLSLFRFCTSCMRVEQSWWDFFSCYGTARSSFREF